VDEQKNPVGRPTLYKPEYAEQAVELVGFGATDKDLAKHFKVHVDTIEEWKKVYPEFSESIKTAKDQVDTKVVRSLFERAMGYHHPETKIVTFEGEITDQIDVERYYPPDATALIFWLKNRQPSQWRDRQDVAISGALPVIVDDLREDKPDGGSDGK
jgi:hypothetical protein